MNALVPAGAGALVEERPGVDARAWMARDWMEGPRALARASRRVAWSGRSLFRVSRTQPPRPPRVSADSRVTERGRASHGFALDFCARHGVELSVQGPAIRTPALVVANHVSWLDPIVLQCLGPMAIIAKREVRSWPLIGRTLDRFSIIWLERDDFSSGAKALMQARAYFERGLSVLVFPEATTSDGRGVLPLRRGMFGLAQRMGVPVTPLSLRYVDDFMAWTGDATFLPHFLKSVSQRRIEAQVDVLGPRYARAHEAPEDFAERVRLELAATLVPGEASPALPAAHDSQASEREYERWLAEGPGWDEDDEATRVWSRETSPGTSRFDMRVMDHNIEGVA